MLGGVLMVVVKVMEGGCFELVVLLFVFVLFVLFERRSDWSYGAHRVDLHR